MSRPKEPLTLWVEAMTQKLIEKTLSSHSTISMMRDYWYTMKGLPEMTQFRKADDTKRIKGGKKPVTDATWSDKINSIITGYIEMIAYQDTSIYGRLGLTSNIFEEGELPIIVITEKETDAFDDIVEKYRAGKAHSTGQLPTFEAVFMVEYLERCEYSEGYIFVFTDYDPAGETIYTSIRDKFLEFSTYTNIHVIHVEMDENIVNLVPNYPLTDNALNKKWIAAGRTDGVEFNSLDVIDYMPPYLEACIEKHLDPRLYVKVSREEWETEEAADIRQNDEEYQKWERLSNELFFKMEAREHEIDEFVRDEKSDFSYDDTEVMNFFTCHRSGETDMTREDVEHYLYLLGALSPYADDMEVA